MCGHTKKIVVTHIFVSALYVTNLENVWTKKGEWYAGNVSRQKNFVKNLQFMSANNADIM
jgi:hypothetical protein